MTAPPASLIFFSASLEKNLAFTTIACAGKSPFPRTLKNPCCVTSKRGAAFSPSAFSLTASGTNDHSLSTFTIGQWYLFMLLWKYLIPTLPKYPGWYLSNKILWWCIPPAFPRPPGCFLCLPTRPWPAETWPLFLRFFFSRVVMALRLINPSTVRTHANGKEITKLKRGTLCELQTLKPHLTVHIVGPLLCASEPSSLGFRKLLM